MNPFQIDFWQLVGFGGALLSGFAAIIFGAGRLIAAQFEARINERFDVLQKDREAEAIGMVNRVVGDAELGETTLAMAQQIAKAPPFGLRLIKRSINRSLDAQGLRTALAAHFDTHQLSHLSEGFLTARDRGLANAIQKNPEKTA